MKHNIKTLTTLALVLSVLLSLASCADRDGQISGGAGQTDDGLLCDLPLPDGETGPVTSGEGTDMDLGIAVPAEAEPSEAAVYFALRLLSVCANKGEGENIVISPYSTLSALALAANGASDKTLAGMELTLGFTLSELNDHLPAYTAALPKTDKAKLTAANSIWIKDDGTISVKPSFLEACGKLYGAEAHRAAFDDGTVRDINKWVSDHTDGRIDKMLDEKSDNAVMYLINATLFDAEWSIPYREDQIRSGVFYSVSGNEETVDFMCSDGRGFRLDGAVGLVRPYAGNTYDFVAVLPDEGVTPEAYLRTLDVGEMMLAFDGLCDASTKIPKFSISTDKELSGELKLLGMEDAFDPVLADFSAMSDDALFISQVLHKATISVDERGTVAGASTAVEMAPGAGDYEPELIEVHLTRPFIFFITDSATHTPIFCGIVNSVL